MGQISWGSTTPTVAPPETPDLEPRIVVFVDPEEPTPSGEQVKPRVATLTLTDGVSTIVKTVPMTVLEKSAVLAGTEVTTSSTGQQALAATGSDQVNFRFALGTAVSLVITGVAVLFTSRRRQT